MKKKIIILLVIILAVIFIGTLFLIRSVPQREPKLLGVTFSKSFAEKFGFDWKKAYEEIFTDLGVKDVRIPVYWYEIEPGKNKWLFDDIDWQLEKAQEHNAKVILAIGRKLPRWPECHEPEWAKNLPGDEKQEAILEMIGTVVEKYKNSDVVSAWQVENEPFLPFGECVLFSKEFLDEEIAVVRQISDKPIIVSDSGEFGTWFGAAKRADIFGSTLYRYAWTKSIGYYTYPLPPAFFRFKQGLVKLFYGEKPMIVVELQAEPWLTKMLYETSYEEQFNHFNPERFKAVLSYIRGTGFDTFYFWGVEWWYWLKQNGHPEMWDMAKEAIQNL